MHTFPALLALVTSASAYLVTQPNGSQGWSNVGPQIAAWQRVDTDPTNFTIVLTNQNRATLPQDQVLVAQQDGVGQKSVQCNPPSGGWPLGPRFRVNLVESTTDQSTIYAQSDEFDIKAPNMTSSGITTATMPTSNTPVAAPPPAITSGSSTTPTSGDNATPSPNGAAATKASSGLVAVLGAVAFFAA